MSVTTDRYQQRFLLLSFKKFIGCGDVDSKRCFQGEPARNSDRTSFNARPTRPDCRLAMARRYACRHIVRARESALS